MTELGCAQMGAREERCPAAQCPQREGPPCALASPSRARAQDLPEHRKRNIPAAVASTGARLRSLLLPTPPPRPPRPPVGLIKLSKIIGVRLDGVNCLDDRRGCLSTAGEEQRRVSSSSPGRRPLRARRGLRIPAAPPLPPGHIRSRCSSRSPHRISSVSQAEREMHKQLRLLPMAGSSSRRFSLSFLLLLFV